MSREIETHKVNGLNNDLRIRAMDDPGHGGVSHHYCIDYYDRFVCGVHFQEGPIQEAGVNGVSNEALLAIVRDRLEGFQSGPYACKDNHDALTYVIMAQQLLRKRTEERVERGVEGTSTV